jgi:CotH protein/lamin tail-like protein
METIMRARSPLSMACLLALLCAPAPAGADCRNIDDPLQVLDLYLEMDPADWVLTLFDTDFQDDGSGTTERPAIFHCGDEAPVPCRVRRKKAAAIPSEEAPVKVSLKIDFDDVIDGADWHGQKKLSLENGEGGVLLSEGLSWQLMNQSGVIAGVSSWVRLHVNGQAIGVYTRVEQMDKRFLRAHLGEDGGFLYKNAVRQTRLGETNPTETSLCYAPFGSGGCAPPAGFAGLSQLCDLPQLLGVAAVNAFLSNWDSLFGDGNNYWYYDSDRPRRYFPWDLDLGMAPNPLASPQRDPFDLLPEVIAYDVIFNDPAIRARFAEILGRLIADPFQPETLDRLLETTLAAVGPAIRDDPLNGLKSSVDDEVARLRTWIRTRHQNLTMRFPALAPPAVVINEVLASNSSSGRDGAGDADDWVELYNRGSEPAAILGLSLSDDPAWPEKWPCPDLVLAPGERLLIWCDDDLAQGPLHASFKLDASGEAIGLYSLVEEVPRVLDFVRFGPQETDRSLGRFPDGSSGFRRLACPTPGEANRDSCSVAAQFRRGDADGDGSLAITDAIRILHALFLGEPLDCRESADIDDDGLLAITDAIQLLDFLFLGGGAPPAPFPACGPDPIADDLGCEAAPGCPERLR